MCQVWQLQKYSFPCRLKVTPAWRTHLIPPQDPLWLGLPGSCNHITTKSYVQMLSFQGPFLAHLVIGACPCGEYIGQGIHLQCCSLPTLHDAPASSAKWGADTISSVSTGCCWARQTRQNRCQANSGARTDPDVKTAIPPFSLFPTPTPLPLSSFSSIPMLWLSTGCIYVQRHACKQRYFLAWAALQLPSKMDKPTHVSKGMEDREGNTASCCRHLSQESKIPDWGQLTY